MRSLLCSFLIARDDLKLKKENKGVETRKRRSEKRTNREYNKGKKDIQKGQKRGAKKDNPVRLTGQKRMLTI